MEFFKYMVKCDKKVKNANQRCVLATVNIHLGDFVSYSEVLQYKDTTNNQAVLPKPQQCWTHEMGEVQIGTQDVAFLPF